MAHSSKTFHFGEDYLTAGIALSIARGTIKGVISSIARKKNTFQLHFCCQYCKEGEARVWDQYRFWSVVHC